MNTVGELHFDNRLSLEAFLRCSIATQIENACNGDNRAWKSTEYHPCSVALILNAGEFSFDPYIQVIVVVCEIQITYDKGHTCTRSI